LAKGDLEYVRQGGEDWRKGPHGVGFSWGFVREEESQVTESLFGESVAGRSGKFWVSRALILLWFGFLALFGRLNYLQGFRFTRSSILDVFGLAQPNSSIYRRVAM
jgi:hypothetical protein